LYMVTARPEESGMSRHAQAGPDVPAAHAFRAAASGRNPTRSRAGHPMRVRPVLATLLLSLAAGDLAAAPRHDSRPNTRFVIDSWQVEEGEEGLPGQVVLAAKQTKDGYLWLGTLFGLARFDGFRFKVFDESNTPELRSGRVVFLFEDGARNLWIGTETE